MPRRKSVQDIYDLLLRLRRGEGIRAIQRQTGTHRTVIRDVRKLADERGWLDENQPAPLLSDVERAWNPGPVTAKVHGLEAYADEIRDYLKEECSFLAIHRALMGRYPCDESTVRRFAHRRFPEFFSQPERPGLARVHVCGDVMEVDFGDLGTAFDPASNRQRRIWVFSGRLRHPRHAFRCIVMDQTTETFLHCLRQSFDFFGGVPKRVVPDNLKAAVVKASFEDPILNRSFYDMAIHYGFQIAPCDPYEPKQKGGVENDIKFIKRDFLRVLRVRCQRQLGQETLKLDAMRYELEQWSQRVSERRIAGMKETVAELFANEQQVLLPLPVTSWEPVSWLQTRVTREWRIRVHKSYYSVPYALIGEEVMVEVRHQQIAIHHQHSVVAVHKPTERDGDYACNPEHAPPGYAGIVFDSVEHIQRQAEAIGPAAMEAVERMLHAPGRCQRRSLRRLLALESTFGRDRFEAACKRALHYDSVNVTSIRSILTNELDQLPLEPSESLEENSPQEAEASSHQQRQAFIHARTSAEFLAITLNINLMLIIPEMYTWTTTHP